MSPATVLALDLGPNSIGWALLDEDDGRIIATGVRIFPEGVDRDQTGGELSKNESRRIARGMRRQIARRARRKRKLREALIKAGLLPAGRADQTQLDALDPYQLRRRGLDQRLEPHEFGRALLHLNQRRGFLSNRKTDKAKKKEMSDMLAEISELEAEIQQAGHRTLGEHFAQLQATDPLHRVRGHHTRRDMYEQEFNQLWEAQARRHPQLLTDELRAEIHKLIFFQRKMYWPKSVVGRCELEPKLRRCPRADRLAQRFRLLQEVNNLRIINPDGEIRSLEPAERDRLLQYLATSKERKFHDIRKHLGLLESHGFNLEFGERKKLLGMPTDKLLSHKDLFGKAWYERPEAEMNEIVRALLEDTDDEEKLKQWAAAEWGLDAETAERLLEVDLPEGYSSFSRVAIEKLLPHLERGLPLMGGDGAPSALVEAGYLRPDQRVIDQREFLPEPPEITNPLVRQALHEVRKVVNAILREYGRPNAIHIELARDVKGTAIQRQELSRQMREREALRDRAAEKIRENGHRANRETIDLYLLWEEQGKVCFYSGRSISIGQLFGGDATIDHILPYSRSLDNSLMNKVVCFRTENDAKRDRTPHEWLAASDPQKYEAVLQRAAKLPLEIRNRKRPKFSQKNVELNDFIARQLVDTRYITRAVVDYVRCLGVDVLGSKGQLTAELRHCWGLNDVLRDDGLNLKSRDDHRHHAVDAIVIALTDRSRLQQLAGAKGNTELPLPWANFRRDAETAVNQINVSHRVRRKVAGALHEETIYGPTDKPGEFVYRKPVETLTSAMIDDIRDPEVKRIIIERLTKFDITPGDKKKIPAEVWKEPLYMTRKQGRKSTIPAVIKKVRLIKRDQTIRPLRDEGTFVKPGSTHHVCLFELSGNGKKPMRYLVAVSMLDAIQRVKEMRSVIQRSHPEYPDARFLMSLSQNEMVLLGDGDAEDLYRFDTAAATTGQMWFRHHTAAGKSAEKLGVVSKKPNTMEARKVTVDVLGRIRWAND